MSFATDDLAGVIVQPDREFAGFAQGMIESWNPRTFSNVVNVRGRSLHDLPVASGVEALTYQPGNVVMLTRWKPRSGRGSASYWIGNAGRVVFPGAGAAERTIAFMQGELARSIAAQVFADRVHFVGVPTFEALSDTDGNWVDLPSDGPVVSDVEVSEAGLALVLHGARMDVSVTNDNGSARAMMSFQASGATSLLPGLGDVRIADAATFWGATSDVQLDTGVGTTTGSLVSLNPGQHTFTAKYQASSIDTSATYVTFRERYIAVIAF